MTLLLHGGLVVRSLSPAVVDRADVLIENKRIAAVAASDARAARVQELDATDCLIVPGAVNAHTHAYSALARGMPPPSQSPTTFLEILQRVWWRLDRALDAQSIRASALVAASDALLSGTTTIVDHHASPNSIEGSLDIVRRACAEVGIRSVLAYEVSDRDGGHSAEAGIEENERFIGLIARDSPDLTRAMVGAHACFTLSEATLDACVELAARTTTGIHIHAAEDGIDAGAVTRLYAAGALKSATLLAHMVHASTSELDFVRSAGVMVSHNCRSNMNNGVGRAPLSHFGPRLALGTDGIGSDMFAEGQAAFLARHGEGSAAAPDWVLDRLSAGAEFVGRAFGEPLLGTLEPGAPADLAVLEYTSPTPIHARNLAAHLIFGLSRSDVRDVIVNGEVVVRDRRLTRVDDREVAAHGREQADRLWHRVAAIPVHEFAPVALHGRSLVTANG